MYMFKSNLALNDKHWLICHKTKPNNAKAIFKKQQYYLTHGCKVKLAHTFFKN